MVSRDSILDDPDLRARYVVGDEVGRGGFGSVYRAQQRATGQTVALKVIRSTTRKENTWARFQREAQLCAALHHPHIVRLIDAHEGEGAWLVFEWVPGRDLATVLAEEGALEPAEAVRLMGQVLDALAAAHGLGIVHRDIKPANIMITHTGARRNAQVLDFGIGALVQGPGGLEAASITRPGDCVGTPAYAAPEQIRGLAPTERVDLYAWALTFIECITGRRVFAGQSLSHVIVQQLGEAPIELPPRLRAHRLGPILARALSKDPARRAVTADALLRALDALGRAEIAALGRPVSASAPGAPMARTRGTGVGFADDPPEPARSSDERDRRQPIDSGDLRFLAELPLLRRLTAGELERLATVMHSRRLAAGEVLAGIGEAGTDAYIVRSGAVVLDLPAPPHEARVVARMGPGTLIGEVCLVEPAPRTLRIRVETDTQIHVIDGQRFGALCDADDPGAHKLLRAVALTLCDRLRQTTSRLQDELRGEPGTDEGHVVFGLSPPLVFDRPWDRLKRLFGRSG